MIMSAGCATISTFQMKSKAHKQLELAENLTSKGDYEGAMKAYGDVVDLFPSDPPGDRALFHMGLIWAHPDNPKNNYQKALTCFQRLVNVFPRSTLKDEAMVWINVMNELLRFEGKAKDLEEEVSALKRRLNGSKKEVNALKTRLNALKEIDIGIEEKKRENRSRE